MAAPELQRAHLHSLAFALDPLAALSSLELALVPFHLDNDEPGHDIVVSKARQVWLDRWRRAGGSTQAGVPPPPPPPAAPPRRAIPEAFVPLVQASGPFPNFKALRLEAQKLGIVEFIRGQSMGGGGDHMRLTSEYRNASVSPPAASAPFAPPPPSVHTANDFHRMSLDFNPSLDNLATLPTYQLLLLQFRDDIHLLPHEAIERVFWRRRASALERGEQLLPLAAEAPRFVPRATSPRAAAYMTSQQGSLSPHVSTAPAPRPPLPALDEPLPPAAYDLLHALQILYLPPDTVSTLPHLLALFPRHLAPLLSILHASAPPPVAPTSSAPGTSVVARSAFVAFPSLALATEAHAHLNGLRVPSSIGGGGAWSLWAGALPSGVRPGWQWGDVRPEAREGMWNEVCEWKAGEERREREAREADEALKRRREDGAGVDAHGGSTKRRRLDVVDKIVVPSEPVPPRLLDSLFPAVITWDRYPKNLKAPDMCDDAFVWRFHAVAWAERSTPSRVELLFTSSADRDRLCQWVESEAKRYWKTNGVVVRQASPDEAALSSWRFSDFSPAWRRQHGIVLDPAAVASTHAQVVGELGEGPDPPPGAPSHWRTGWFAFEYVLHGQTAPVRQPMGVRRSTSALIGRLGGLVGDGSSMVAAASSSEAAARRASRDDNALGPPCSPPSASSSAAGPSRASAFGDTSGAHAPHLDGPDPTFYLEPFSSYSPSIDSDPFASILSPPSPSSATFDDPLETSLSSLDVDDDLATSTSVFAAAKSFRLSPVSDYRGVKGLRVDAIALSDFVDEFDCAMDEAAQLFGTEVEQDEQDGQAHVEAGAEQSHDEFELPVVELEQGVDQGVVDMDVEVGDESASDTTSLEVGSRAVASLAPSAAADYVATEGPREPATPSSPSLAAREPAGPDQASSSLELPRPSAPELSLDAPQPALVADRTGSSGAAESSTRSDPLDPVVLDRPLTAASSPSRSPSQLQRADAGLTHSTMSSSPMRVAERDEPGRSSTPPSPLRPVVAADAPTAEALNAADASTSTTGPGVPGAPESSSSAVGDAAAGESYRPPLAARLSSACVLDDGPLACRLSLVPLPVPTPPPLAARLGLRPSSSTPPPPDRSSSSWSGPSLSLAERLSPRASGRLSRTSPRREAAALPSVVSEPV